MSSQVTLNEYDNYETPKEVYQRLIQLINNQMNSPQVLPYNELVIECVIEQIQHMTENLKRLSSKLDQFCIEQHTTELSRLSYASHQYLRVRLNKIELNSNWLIQTLQTNYKFVDKLLSKNEMKYLDNYVTSVDTYLNQSVLGRLPFNRTSIMNYKTIDLPNNDDNQWHKTYVFVKAMKATQVLVDDASGQQTVHLDANSQHFLPYTAVRRHLMNDSQDLHLL
ncbi:DNA replication complex GINS protein SLD5-like [Oppia nitens]|uniref:DNA replication complex GINS protein SLD5-like n=1 Tax=Oppia nitens TaxID=1686743 RepID=UPI0023D9E01D|nr:DNA replication complex GINS protein SLD5-like [Oppia nitens]